MDLLPPPSDQHYSSLKDLIFAANKHAAPQGYAISCKRTKKSKKDEVRKAWLGCDQGSKYKSKNSGKRKSASQATECLFSLIAIRDAASEIWTFDVVDFSHNHEASLPGAHSIHRKNALTEDVQNTIVAQTRIKSSAKQIFNALRIDDDEENPFFKPQDIHNARASLRRKELGPHIVIQALMMELDKGESWFMRYSVNDRGRIDRLFFAKTSAQKILKFNYEVALMNCTYKINVYRMPLCIINGVTAMNTTFYIAFCFLFRKGLKDYR